MAVFDQLEGIGGKVFVAYFRAPSANSLEELVKAMRNLR
jgi:hypothetical protein